jgi:hypothetical protein
MRGSTIHAAGLSLMLCLGLAACEREPPAGNRVTSDPANETRPAAPVALPEPEPPLGRSQLLDAARRAASAYAARRLPPAEAANLAGREFTLTIPFGCGGPEGAERPAGLSWSYDAEEERLRLRAEPTIDVETAAVAAIGGNYEAVEGFWIPRPWTDSEDCPPPPGAAAPEDPAQPTPPSVGLAQFFTAADSRTRQRAGRAYESVARIEADQLPNAQGFGLVIEGRIATVASDRTIVCHSPRPDIRPNCVIAVEIDRVAFLNPRSGTTLASWEPR